jgi:hypothetical protein
MKRVFIQEHRELKGAGIWIYEGYRRAWESLGYESVYLKGQNSDLDMYATQDLFDSGDYVIMGTDMWYDTWRTITKNSHFDDKLDKFFKSSERSIAYCQPNTYPMPWGSHPNFVCGSGHESIDYINSQNNFKLWSYSDVQGVKDKYYPSWKHIETIPLAFDNISYEYLEDEKYKFDVCFVGGRANNGFDEKYKIMIKHFSAFKDSGLKCGIFVGKNLTHEQENKLLYNSKVAINIHDAYQRELRLDTNERTFKALGLTGVLVSDDEGQLERLFPDVKRTNDPKEMVKFVKEYVNMPEEELNSIKEKNRKIILDNHTYVHRVKQILQL